VVANSFEFWMGEGQERHRQQIGRSFAIASKEVTVEQFLRFRKDQQFDNKIAATGDCPVNEVSWCDAAEYCNWLSEQEGIPKDQWCYEPNKDRKYREGMKMAANYLKRTGYRLPTEAEWEYSCRAGGETAYSFGEPDELLGKYAWFLANSRERTRPVGKLRPNDLGLFDMHGNVWELCQDALKEYGKGGDEKATEDNEDKTDISNIPGRVFRVYRGGSFILLASQVSSAFRLGNVPTDRHFSIGFRPARTLPPDSFTALPPPPEGGEK